MKVEKVADVLGIIVFFGAIVAGIWGAVFASKIMIWLGLGYIIIFLLVRVWQLGRENKKLRQAMRSADTDVEVNICFDEPIWISSERRNQIPVPSDFIQFDRCTILFNVQLPEKGEGLRKAPSNKYLVAHCIRRDGNDTNVFGVKYSMHDAWEITFSNNKGEHVKKYLRIEDELEPGWHQFIISWNKNLPEIVFQIINPINNARWMDRTVNYLNNWPERFDESITVGAWTSPYPDSYIETKIANFWVCNEAIDIDNPIIQEHREMIW